ncbi:MAG: FlgD immunoglobulin-like domain containing protein [Gemmatimonadota bacterium]
MAALPTRPSRPCPAAAALLALLCLAAGDLGAVTVSVPDTLVGRGAGVLLPVRLGDPAPGKVVAAEVSVAWDPSLLTYRGLLNAGSLTASWLLDSVVVHGPKDTLKIVAATAADTARTAGVLLSLDFLAPDRRRSTTIPVELTYALLNNGTPSASAVSGSVSLAGVDGTIEATPAAAAPGQPVQVAVTDADEDRTGSVDPVRVRVVNGAQYETLTALESGAATGQFQAAIHVAFSLGWTSGDGVVQAISGDHLQFCYDDSLSATGGLVSRCSEVLVTGASDADLSATAVVEPSDTAWVRLNEPDLNVVAGTAETVDLGVTNARTHETATITLTETGPDTHVFLGRFFTAFGSGAGSAGDQTLNIQKGDTLQTVYADLGTAAGGTALVVARCVAVDPFGDASGNGTVRGFDASLILEHSVGSLTLAGLDSLAANLDLLAPYGPITAFDASLILQYRVGLLGRFPVRGRQAGNHPQPETGAAPRPAATETMLALVPTPEGELALVADERGGIVSLDLLVSGFAGRITASPEAAGFLVTSRATAAGTRIAAAAAQGVEGPGELLRLWPRGAATAARLEAASLNDGQIAAVWRAASAAAAPADFRLLPNLPNPFNPETAIPFRLAAPGQVQLEVMNPLGQTVRRLAAGWLEAGAHQVNWDGRDDSGAPVAGGVYFYRLVTPTHRAVRKMTLLK